MSDIEGKAARVAASECGQRASFKSLLILIKSGDICRSVCFILIRMTYQARDKAGVRTRLACWRLRPRDRDLLNLRFNDLTFHLSRRSYGKGGTNPWHAKALATAAYGDNP